MAGIIIPQNLLPGKCEKFTISPVLTTFAMTGSTEGARSQQNPAYREFYFKKIRRFRSGTTIKVKGASHLMAIDGKIVFEGEDDRNSVGGFTIAPGWGWNKTEYVEIDELLVKK